MPTTAASATRSVVWRNPVGRRKRAGLAVKRSLDVVAASALLLILFPVMFLIGVLVAVTSPGGPLFVQERVGRDAKNFRLYKFRTMREGTYEEVMSDPDLRAQYEANDFKLANTDRHITPIGSFLRKASLDELPQLWNVLRGDMSLVGVRPLLRHELAQRPPFDQVLYSTARPGLTGLWQVGGRSDVTGTDRIALDRTYIEDWGLLNDAKILCRTPLAVVRVERTR